MLLGCLATDLVCAIEFAGVLTRSAIPVTVHTTPPAEPLPTHDSSPFHILVLNPAPASVPQQLEQAAGWLQEANAQRIALIHPRHVNQEQQRSIANLADNLLTFASNGRAVTMCHCERANTSPALEDYLSLPVIKTSTDWGQQCAGDIAGFIKNDGQTTQLTQVQGATNHPTSPAHLMLKATTENEFLSIIRGTERARILCGSPDLALHLPALFRVRGWLTSEQHIKAVKPHDDSPRLVCGPLSSCPQIRIQQDWIVNTEQDLSVAAGLGTSSATHHASTSDTSSKTLIAQTCELQAWLSSTLAKESDQPVTLCTFTQEPETWSVSTIQADTSQSSRLLFSRASVTKTSDLATTLKLGGDYLSEG